MMIAIFRLLTGLVLTMLVIGCAVPARSSEEPSKIAAMISTLESLADKRVKDKQPLEIRFYVSIAPTSMGTDSYHCDRKTGASFQILYSGDTIDSATVASLTEVMLNRDKSLFSGMTRYVWERGEWLSELDWHKRHFPKETLEWERIAEEWPSRLQPTTASSGPTSKP